MNNMYYEKDTIFMSHHGIKKGGAQLFVDQNNNNVVLSPDGSGFIRDFYDDAIIFVTGATGFLGKVLLEKLLRSCDGLRTILVLLRPKRGLTSEQRFEELLKNPVFDRIRSKQPEMLERLEYVSGDIVQDELGLSDQDRQRLMDEVNIVFHVAATVRFNESLKDAANLNTLGTQRVMELCAKMKSLKVSTSVSPSLSFLLSNLFSPSPSFSLHLSLILSISLFFSPSLSFFSPSLSFFLSVSFFFCPSLSLFFFGILKRLKNFPISRIFRFRNFTILEFNRFKNFYKKTST